MMIYEILVNSCLICSSRVNHSKIVVLLIFDYRFCCWFFTDLFEFFLLIFSRFSDFSEKVCVIFSSDFPPRFSSTEVGAPYYAFRFISFYVVTLCSLRLGTFLTASHLNNLFIILRKDFTWRCIFTEGTFSLRYLQYACNKMVWPSTIRQQLPYSW